MLGSPKLKILDCSSSMGRQPGDCQRLNFTKSHIKGALFLDMDYFKDLKSDLPFMLPSEQYFIEIMKNLNVKLSDKVVCYDAGPTNFFGYRAAWMLQAMGHPNVCVLDGGFKQWVDEGKPTDSCEGTPAEEDFGYKIVPEKLKVLD